MQIQDTNERMMIIFEHPSEREHFDVLLRAMEIFSERRPLRGSEGWRRYGAKGAAFFIKDRANRIWDTIQIHRMVYADDALDIINYAVFCIRAYEEDNYGGEFWPN